VTDEEGALAASVVFSGLWSGLLGMLTLVMHPMLAAMGGRDFENFLRAFLPVARKAWFNYVCAIGMAIEQAAILFAACSIAFMQWLDEDDAPPRPVGFPT
jgi:hypothetical protein